MATSGSGSSGPAADSTENQRSPSPPKYSMPEDARKKPSEYPNYWVRKTRSGHVVMMDDTKGNEHLTIQHRSGTMMQFLPDGALHISTNKGRYDTTFGEQRTKVTGSSDLTASGVSIRAKVGEAAGGGTVAVTADKNFELAASESATLVTNKMSVAAGEFLHMGSKSVVMNATEGMKLTSSQQASISAQKDIAMGSETGSVGIAGNKYAALGSNLGTVVRTSDSSGSVQLTNTSGQISIEGKFCYINCNRPTISPTPTPVESTADVPFPKLPDLPPLPALPQPPNNLV
jgi:hypothetical protein